MKKFIVISVMAAFLGMALRCGATEVPETMIISKIYPSQTVNFITKDGRTVAKKLGDIISRTDRLNLKGIKLGKDLCISVKIDGKHYPLANNDDGYRKNSVFTIKDLVDMGNLSTRSVGAFVFNINDYRQMMNGQHCLVDRVEFSGCKPVEDIGYFTAECEGHEARRIPSDDMRLIFTREFVMGFSNDGGDEPIRLTIKLVDKNGNSTVLTDDCVFLVIE